jgi:glutamyl-tRNA reductase
LSIILVGLNHKTAPVELREKLVLSDDHLQQAFADLRDLRDLQEGTSLLTELVILSTCNRLEIYASTMHEEEAVAQIDRYLSTLQNKSLTNHLYKIKDEGAILHLMRVASGLDSMILGEGQILGQIAQAFERAQNIGMTGAVLSRLFAQAIHTGKRSRTETTISRYTTSVSHTAAVLLENKLHQVQAAHVLVIGAGEMAILAAQALKRRGINTLTFINRTYNNAERLAVEFGGKALDWHQLEPSLIRADAVICATGAPHIVMYRRDVEAILPQRQGRPLVIVDIAVPRDVEDSVRDLAGVDFYDIDDLQSVVDTNLELRTAAIPEVETIIQQEINRFTEWYNSREVTPIIKDLRAWAQGIADDELLHTLNRLADTDERTRQIVSQMAHRLVNRILHEPTARLRVQANEGNGYGYAHAVQELFALNAVDSHDCQQDPLRCGTSSKTSSHTSDRCDLRCIMPSKIEQLS